MVEVVSRTCWDGRPAQGFPDGRGGFSNLSLVVELPLVLNERISSGAGQEACPTLATPLRGGVYCSVVRVRVLTARSTWGRFRPAPRNPSALRVRLHDNGSNF